MESGAIFDVYQDGKPTWRGLKLKDGSVVNLNKLIDSNTLDLDYNVDFENEVVDVLVENIQNL